MITGTARDQQSGITLEVGPGGVLIGLGLTQHSMRLGGRGLAAAILRMTNQAAAEANLRAKHAFDLDDSELNALGITVDARLAEAAESTVPDTWRI